MSWNHRVIRTTYQDQLGEAGKEEMLVWFAVYEVYYDEDGKPNAWTKEPTHPVGDSFEELSRDFNYFQQALLHPVLEIIEEDGKKKLVEWKE